MYKIMNDVKCTDKFSVRVPYFPFEYYESLFNEKEEDISFEKIANFVEAEFFENIFVSNPNILSFDNNYNQRQISATLQEYIIRSIVRTTPYGLYSSILVGEFGESNNNIIENEFKKKVRVDFEWLIEVIKIYEKIIGRNLKIIRNYSTDVSDYHVYNLWETCFSGDKINSITQIKNTRVVTEILNSTQNYVKVFDVIDKILQIYPNRDEEFLLNFIFELIEKEFLISDLRPFVIQEKDSFNIFIGKLKKYEINKHEIRKLNQISILIQEYEQLGINKTKSINKLDHITKEMAKIYKTTEYLRMDLYNETNIEISSKIQEDLNEIVGLLSNYSFVPSYRDYTTKFLEQYGNQAVKAVDVFHGIKGLGLPIADYEREESDLQNKIVIEGMLKDFFKNGYTPNDSLDFEEYRKYKKEDKDFENSSFSLAVYLMKNDIDYQYFVSPIFGNNEPFSINGRFNYIFSEDRQNIKTTNSKIKMVELSFLPKIRRHCNVMSTVGNSENAFVEIGTHTIATERERIDLDDIYMCVLNDKFKFIQKSTNQELKFYTNNVYNRHLFPSIFSGLYHLSFQDTPLMTNLFTELKELNRKFAFFPRIIYKKFILYPKTVVIKKDAFIAKNKIMEQETFNYKFKNILTEYDFSERVLVGIGDRRILLNVKIQSHMEIIRKLLNKEEGEIFVTENYFEQDKLILENRRKK